MNNSEQRKDTDVSPVESASMWMYLWDLADGGYAEVFARLKENRLDAISLASAYHAGKFLTPHNPKRKVVFLEDGTVYFRPRQELFGRVQPRVNSLVENGDDLAKTVREAEKAGLQVNAWVVCCHNTPLGTAYPDIACRNAFGDAVSHNLCPSHPDVRAYLRGVVRNVAEYGVGRIELEAMQFQPFVHGFHHEREGIALNPAMRFLLGLCFCPSCRARAAAAHVEIAKVLQFTKETLERFFEDERNVADRYASVSDLPEELFDAFHAWRRSVIVSLAGELQEAVNGTSTVLRPMATLDADYRVVIANDPAAVAQITGGVLALGYVKDGSALRAPLAELQRNISGKEIVAGFQVGLPESGGREEFADRMRVAREMGIRKFNFYNYGFIPHARLGWIREAVKSD